MLLRKINAIISLIATALLMNHAVSHAILMLTGRSLIQTTKVSWILCGVMAAHAILSIVLAIRGHKGAEKRKCKEYSKLNIQTNIQRIGGTALILFTALHILGTVGILEPPPLVHAILPPIFFTVALMHVAVSGSKALITLGIGNAKAIKIIDSIIKMLCVVTLIADITGFYLHL